MQFGDIYRGKRVIVTGHTGFKGSWLVLWLTKLGARVTGISEGAAPHQNHLRQLNLSIDEYEIDIRDATRLREAVVETKPSVLFHLAAQPLVRRSYRDPLETWTTNVIGTANTLDACREVPALKAIVAITTDKVYSNQNWSWGYREIDRLGGHDPYSASKAACELVIDSYRRSYFSGNGGALVATARSGNVLGGGDWSEDRLIPDLVKAIAKSEKMLVRYPRSTRPWQHVLDPLSGYLLLGQRLLEGRGEVADAWNFGPRSDGNRSVLDVLSTMKRFWNKVEWQIAEQPDLHEAGFLFLDISKAQHQLDWQPTWEFQDTIAQTAEWYKTYQDSQSVSTLAQLEAFVQRANAAGATWCRN